MTNPAAHLALENQLKTIASIKDVYGDGTFYSMESRMDLQIDRILDLGIGDYSELRETLGKLLVTGSLPQPFVDAGCTVFAVKNKAGHVLVGRNYDFKHEIGVMAVKCTRTSEISSKVYSPGSIGMSNLRFLDFRPGQLSDGKTDVSASVMFPYMTVDGMNGNGVFISVLLVPGKGTIQNTGKKKILTTVAMRAVLEKAASVEDAVRIFDSYDIQIDSPVRDFHFFAADRSGRSAAIEYIDGQITVTETPLLTNFYIAPGSPEKKEGRDRYAIVKGILDYHGAKMEKQDVMDTLRLVSQPAGPRAKSDTLWSAVYDLTAGTMDAAVGHRYDDIRSFAISGL